ncbi:MAG: hypothetical protein JNM98_06030 [Rhodocyclaceae bacterium]|nr:hypothetical protein [Rhodocyclaceae bacterium]
MAARLREQEIRAIHVLSAADVAQQAERAPAAIIVPGTYRIKDASPGQALVTQKLDIICVVKTAAQTEAVERARNAASPLVDRVLAALLGWAPEGCSDVLTLTDSTYRPTFGPGTFNFPLAFAADVYLGV